MAKAQTKSVHDILGGPFRVACDAGVPVEDMMTLALAFRSSNHGDPEVWACLRLARALSGYKTKDLGDYLMGCHFAECMDDCDTFKSLSSMKMHAEDFLAQEDRG